MRKSAKIFAKCGLAKRKTFTFGKKICILITLSATAHNMQPNNFHKGKQTNKGAPLNTHSH